MRAQVWPGEGDAILSRSCEAAGGGLVNAFVVSDGTGNRLVLRAPSAASAKRWVDAIKVKSPNSGLWSAHKSAGQMRGRAPR